ncbi:ABC transporter permease, partial [Planococcus sp. SIMBA_143]
LFLFHSLFDWDMTIKDYGRVLLLSLLYSTQFLFALGMVEIIIFSQKLRLLLQSIVSGVYLLISGALIPTIYFPVFFQKFIDYVPSVEALHWVQEIVLNNRVFVDYIPLLLLT